MNDTATQGGAYYRVVPYEYGVWQSYRGMAKPGDVLEVDLSPPWEGAKQVSHAQWFAELCHALDQGIELHTETAGNLRHGMAMLREIANTMRDLETQITQREEWAATEIALADGRTDAEFERGFKQGVALHEVLEKHLNERRQARERQRRKRAKADAPNTPAEAAPANG